MTKACYICLKIICNAHLFHTSPAENWIQGVMYKRQMTETVN